MTDGLNLDGFTANIKAAGTNDINVTGTWSPATGSFPAAADMSTQGNAGLNQEGSYDMGTRGGETNAYPESENM
jgi:hypothetical protein